MFPAYVNHMIHPNFIYTLSVLYQLRPDLPNALRHKKGRNTLPLLSFTSKQFEKQRRDQNGHRH